MKKLLKEKKNYILNTYEQLSNLNIIDKPSNDKWNEKEILGHLVDSAANNHQRFIRGQFQDNLIFMGYNQNEWVTASQYNKADWNILIQFWKNYNLLLIHIIGEMSEDILHKNRKNNLEQIGWKEYIAVDELTMYDLIIDYFDHLEHHINQIFDKYN